MIRSLIVGLAAATAIVVPVTTIVAAFAVGSPNRVVYLLFVPIIVVFAAVGWLLATRRPDNVIGTLCLAFALVFAAYFPIDLLVSVGSTAPAVAIAATLSSASDAPGFILVALILLVFPDGRFPSPRWRWLGWVAAIGMVAALIGFGLRPGALAAFPSVDNPLGIPGFPGDLVGEIGYVVLMGLLVAAVAALVVRWRRGSTLERTQIKWVAAASVVLLVGEIASLLTFDPTNPLGNPITFAAATLCTAVVPLAMGVAILRYRLYEIDRLISRTIGWAIVTGLLVAVFAGAVVGLQALLAGFTQGQTLAVAASTLVAFALFQPVRRQVQRAVDRRFDRARYDAERTAGAFADRLRDETDIETVTADLTATTRAALAPAGLGIWIRRS